MRRSRTALAQVLVLVAVLGLGATLASAQTPKAGGHLAVMLRKDLAQGFAVHEASTISTSFQSLPCFNNLIFFDQLKRPETPDTLVGDLAEKWSWQDNYRNLVFFLRKNVKWHDGQPFTSKDVKHTFDMLREAPDATVKLRINPRKDWYANVDAVEAPDPHTVVFRLKRPQSGLLNMLASGYTPIYAAHVNPAAYRTGCIGTGPFKVKEWRKGEYVDYVKNPDYFVKGRPYLDSLRYVVIKERGTRVAAIQAGQLDVSFPGETTKTAAEQLKKAVPQLVITPVAQAVSDNIIMNVKKSPFDNLKVRQAVS
jgi:peptide/nickel transport system substrate-binding protein